MSVMDRDRWSKLGPLLDAALELSPDDRTECLAALSTTAPDDVVAELRQLLAADAAAGRRSFLERPVELTLAGVRVGAYTLERPLGDGGMGSVWLARRTDGRFDGVAAVKLLDLALLTEAGQAR